MRHGFGLLSAPSEENKTIDNGKTLGAAPAPAAGPVKDDKGKAADEGKKPSAATVRMEKIEIFVISTLFTPYRVDMATVPAGLT